MTELPLPSPLATSAPGLSDESPAQDHKNAKARQEKTFRNLFIPQILKKHFPASIKSRREKKGMEQTQTRSPRLPITQKPIAREKFYRDA